MDSKGYKKEQKRRKKFQKGKDCTESSNAQDQEEINIRTLRRKSEKSVLSVRTPLMGKIYRSNAKKDNGR